MVVGAISPCHPQPRAFGKLALRFASHSTFGRQRIRLPMCCVLNFASQNFAATRSMSFDHGIFFLVSRCWRSILYSRGWAVMGTGCSGGPANAPIVVFLLLVIIIIPLGKWNFYLIEFIKFLLLLFTHQSWCLLKFLFYSRKYRYHWWLFIIVIIFSLPLHKENNDLLRRLVKAIRKDYCFDIIVYKIIIIILVVILGWYLNRNSEINLGNFFQFINIVLAIS